MLLARVAITPNKKNLHPAVLYIPSFARAYVEGTHVLGCMLLCGASCHECCPLGAFVATVRWPRRVGGGHVGWGRRL